MLVQGIPLFVAVIREEKTKWPRNYWFQTTKFKVPIFEEITVFVTDTTIFTKESKTLTTEEVEYFLRPYILKPTPPELSPVEQRLLEAIGLIRPFLEAFWIRVNGELSGLQLEGDDVIEDAKKAENLVGDMDMPITGLAPWAFVINATSIALEIKPSPYYPGI